MPIATGTAIALGLATGSGVLNYLGARSQGKSVEKASEQQQQGVREARAYAEPLYQRAEDIATQTYNQNRPLLDPYLTTGSAATQALGAFLGIGPGTPPPPLLAGGYQVRPNPALARTLPAVGPLAASPSGTAVAPSRADVTYSGVPSGMVPLSTLAGGSRAAATVRLRAPTGQIADIPADQVEFYLSRGATRV